jgi:hypothetical protein
VVVVEVMEQFLLLVVLVVVEQVEHLLMRDLLLDYLTQAVAVVVLVTCQITEKQVPEVVLV